MTLPQRILPTYTLEYTDAEDEELMADFDSMDALLAFAGNAHGEGATLHQARRDGEHVMGEAELVERVTGALPHPAPASPAAEAAPVEGSWPDHCEQRAFVAGAKWWQYHRNGATAFASEVDEMEGEAVHRYGEPARATLPPLARLAALRAAAVENDHPHAVEMADAAAGIVGELTADVARLEDNLAFRDDEIRRLREYAKEQGELQGLVCRLFPGPGDAIARVGWAADALRRKEKAISEVIQIEDLVGPDAVAGVRRVVDALREFVRYTGAADKYPFDRLPQLLAEAAGKCREGDNRDYWRFVRAKLTDLVAALPPASPAPGGPVTPPNNL